MIWSTITYFYFDGCFYKTTKLSEIRVRKHMSRFYFSINIFNFNTGLWSHPSCISTYLFTIIKKSIFLGKICGPHSWCPLTTYLPTYFVCIFRNYPTKIHNRTPHIIYMLCIATASFGDRVTFTTSDEYLLYISWYDKSFNKNTRFNLPTQFSQIYRDQLIKGKPGPMQWE